MKAKTILYWLNYVKIMDKADFFRLMKCCKIPYNTDTYNSLHKYFDVNCNSQFNKKHFKERLDNLRDNHFNVILTKFFELSDKYKLNCLT